MAKIVGMSRKGIFQEADRLLRDTEEYKRMSEGENPFGDGRASERIVETVIRWYQGKMPLLDPDKEFKPPAGRHPLRPRTGAWEEEQADVPEKTQLEPVAQ